MEKDKKPARSFDLDKKPARSFDLKKRTAHSFDLNKNDEAGAIPAPEAEVGAGKKSRLDSNKTEEPAVAPQSQAVSPDRNGLASEKKTQSDSGKNKKTAPAAQPQPAGNNPANTSAAGNSGNHGDPKTRKWLWILLLAAVAGGTLVWGMNRCESRNSDSANTAEQAEVTPADSLDAEKKSENAASSVMPANDGEAAQNGETTQNGTDIAQQGKQVSSNTSSASDDAATRPNAQTDEATPSATPSTPSTSPAVTAPEYEAAPRSRKEYMASSASGSSNRQTDVPDNLKDAVRDVLAGKYGNWPERERHLGNRYKEVQKEVNRLYRSGMVNR